VIFLISVSVYSIAESATSKILVSEQKGSTGSWYEETAIFICLLH
jgi:hypothetical protein